MPHKDEAQKRAEERKAWEDALAAEAKRKAEITTAAPDDAPKKPMKVKSVKFAPVPEKSKGWTAVLEAYKVYSKEHGVDVDPKTGALVFNSRDDAIDFFKAQAKLGHEFFAREFSDGKAVDYYVLSCGDKHLYKGPLADIKKDLEAAIIKRPGDSVKLTAALDAVTKAMAPPASHATRMREELQGKRSGELGEAKATAAPVRR